MNKHAISHTAAETPLIKADPNSPAIRVTGADSAMIKAGTHFDGHVWDGDTSVVMPAGGLEAGADYGVMIATDGVSPQAVKLIGAIPEICFAGFHFAPG